MAIPALALPDYALLPPEINSGRMYTGAGGASLAASAAAWQTLAANLGSTAAGLQAVLGSLVGTSWQGPSSAAMAAAAAPYVAWVAATAGQAQQAAVTTAAAGAAFETARAAVIPPPLIEANRNLLMTLTATNFLGINTPAIAATEAAYAEFWAQDAAAMFAYSADAAALTGSLVPFTPPPPMTEPGGLATQAAAVAQASGEVAGQAAQQAAAATQQGATGMDAQTLLTMGPQLIGVVPQLLQGLAQPLQAATGPLQSVMGQFQSLLAPVTSALGTPGGAAGVGTGVGTGFGAPVTAGIGGAGGPVTAGVGGAGGGVGPVTAGVGGAGRPGGLSVPASWTGQTNTAAGPVQTSARSGAAPASTSGTPGMAPMGAGGPAAMAARPPARGTERRCKSFRGRDDPPPAAGPERGAHLPPEGRVGGGGSLLLAVLNPHPGYWTQQLKIRFQQTAETVLSNKEQS